MKPLLASVMPLHRANPVMPPLTPCPMPCPMLHLSGSNLSLALTLICLILALSLALLLAERAKRDEMRQRAKALRGTAQSQVSGMRAVLGKGW